MGNAECCAPRGESMPGVTWACEKLFLDDRMSEQYMTVSLDRRSAERLGLDVDLSLPDVLPIIRITPGPVSEWNEAHPQAQILVGDIIVRVNDAEGNTDTMMERLKTDDMLRVTLMKAASQQAGPEHRPAAEEVLSSTLGADIPGADPKTLRGGGRLQPPCMCGVTTAHCIVPWIRPLRSKHMVHTAS